MDWENKYASGHAQRYPWDSVVSFLYRYGKHRDRVLEVGCGTGSNLWFAAREGFIPTGIDSSTSAIAYAKTRFSSEGLRGDFLVGDLLSLPLGDESFDIAIDRAAICCVEDTSSAIKEIRRVLAPGGIFLFTPYSKPKEKFQYHSKAQIEKLLSNWEILRLQHIEITDEYSGWKVIARKH